MYKEKTIEENLTSRLFAVQKVYGNLLELDENNIKDLMLENIENLGTPKNATVNKIYKTTIEHQSYLEELLKKNNTDIKDSFIKSIILCAICELIYLGKDIKIIVSQYQKIASLYYDDKQIKQISKIINQIGEEL